MAWRAIEVSSLETSMAWRAIDVSSWVTLMVGGQFDIGRRAALLSGQVSVGAVVERFSAWTAADFGVPTVMPHSRHLFHQIGPFRPQ
jgi:hypothetical protein